MAPREKDKRNHLGYSPKPWRQVWILLNESCYLPMKGIVNFKITIVNPGPSTCRNGERDQKKSISFVLFPEALMAKIWIFINIYFFNFYQLKGFFRFESKIVNTRPSACRNGERDCAAINATEICCSSVLPMVQIFFSLFHTIPQHATKFLQHRFRSVWVSTHVIVETIRTCGLIKIN